MIKKNKAKHTKYYFSDVGFGASPFGNIYNDNITSSKAKHLVSKAIDLGINYFDVAPYYGATKAETILGQSLPKNKENLILSTKVGRYGLNSFDFSKKTIQNSLEASLKRLKTDHINIIFCHDIEYVSKEIILNEAIPTLETLKQKGYLSHIGISGYPLNNLETLSSHPEVDIVLSYGHYNLLNQTLMKNIQNFEKNNVDIINASPFCMGLLTHSNCPDWHPYNKKDDIKKTISALSEKKINIEKESFIYALNQQKFVTTLTGISKIEYLNNLIKWSTEKHKNNVVETVNFHFKDHQNINWL